MPRQTAVFTESRIRIIGHPENQSSLKKLNEAFIGLVALHRAGQAPEEMRLRVYTQSA